MKKYSLICFCVLFFLLSCDFMPYGDSVILENKSVEEQKANMRMRMPR